MKKQSIQFTRLVSLLNDGQYHDGTTIGATLKVTRGAIWKAMKKLAHYGIPVDSIKGKGYALLEPLVLLDKKTIQKGLDHPIDVAVFETLDSTNAYFKKNPTTQKMAVCISEEQTQGKGRFDRSWHSPFGQNLYLSCAYLFQKDVSELAGLSLVVSLAVTHTLQHFPTAHSFLVKWPNDILYAHQKISGNVIDIQAESHGACQAIIGIGINVNMLKTEAHTITQSWTSLRQVSAQYIDRNALSILLINTLQSYLQMFDVKGLAPFYDEWKTVDYLANQSITLKQGNEKFQGKVLGIDSLGHLQLKIKKGDVMAFSSGEATILK